MTFDSTTFEVHKEDGIMCIRALKNGIFYLRLNNDVLFVTKVEVKIYKYTVREYLSAIEAHEI